MNRPVSGGAPNMAAVPAIAAARPAWVRVNFVRDGWTEPGDPVRRGPSQLTWYEAFDELVDAYLAQGIQVYGLIGAESTNASGELDSDEWRLGFAADALTIIDHFKD